MLRYLSEFSKLLEGYYCTERGELDREMISFALFTSLIKVYADHVPRFMLLAELSHLEKLFMEVSNQTKLVLGLEPEKN